MTDLTRKEQLIFANNSATNQVAVFGSKAQTGTMAFSSDPDVIQDVENNGQNWQAGWNNAVINGNSPLMEDFNAISYVNSYNIAYLLQKGIAEWSANTTYYKGSIVMVLNSGIPSIYYSEQDNNDLNPNDSGWVKIPFSELPDILDNKANINLDNITEDGENVIKNVISGSYADKDLSNTTPSQTFIDQSMNWNAVDYTSEISLTPNASFTPDFDGVVVCSGDYNNLGGLRLVLGNTDNQENILVGNAGYAGICSFSIPVQKGVEYYLVHAIKNTFGSYKLYPLKGVNNV